VAQPGSALALGARGRRFESGRPDLPAQGPRPPQGQEKRIEIRWRDLDSYGHVNQAVYLTYAEEVLDDWFRTRLGREPGTVWDYVARRTTIDYRDELRLADRVAVGTTELVALGTTSVTAKVTLSAPDGRVATELELVVVVIDGQGGAPRPLSDAERAALAGEGQEFVAAGVEPLG
jgi:acyl-CoA thioester hydrolase